MSDRDIVVWGIVPVAMHVNAETGQVDRVVVIDESLVYPADAETPAPGQDLAVAYTDYTPIGPEDAERAARAVEIAKGDGVMVGPDWPSWGLRLLELAAQPATTEANGRERAPVTARVRATQPKEDRMTYPETSASGIKVLDRVQVASTLNGGRYTGRWATVLNVPSTKNPRYRVQLDKFTRGLEPMDGCLFLSESEIVVPEPGSHSIAANRDIWHDDDGVWAQKGDALLGPFVTEAEAEAEYNKED